MDMHQLKNAVSSLSGQEAKSLLQVILIRTESIDEEFPGFMQSVKKALIKRMEKASTEINPETVHIVFGSSTAGSLKSVFRGTSYEQTEEIIELTDYFAEGPLKELDATEGFEKRCQWLKESYQWDSDHAEWYKKSLKEAFEKIQSIQPGQRVVIWTGENANEQTGLRIVLYLLKEKANAIFELNTYDAYHKLYKGRQKDFPYYSGILLPEQLLAFYELHELKELSEEARRDLAKEGEDLIHSDALLRTYENGKVMDSECCRDDAFIIEKMRELQDEKGKTHFFKAARIVGEVLGHMVQYTSDEWIEYRLRRLIAQGKVEYRGELCNMMDYEVKLKEAFAG